jgi:hypothetical protein
MMNRYGVSNAAGQRDGKHWAVVDRQDRQGGKGMVRVSFHKTAAQAKAAAQRMNREGRD